MKNYPSLASGAIVTAVGVLMVAANAYAQAPRPATPVEIVAPRPVPTIDAAATQAFQVTFCDDASFFGFGSSCPDDSISFLAVPADRSLVIEYISTGFCFASNLSNYEVGIATKVNGVFAEHRIP